MIESNMLLSKSICHLTGVGEKIKNKLLKLGIRTYQDLIFHLPLRYQDKTRITPIINLRVGDLALIEGVIINSEIKKAKRESLLLTIKDNYSYLYIRFFHFNYTQRKTLRIDQKIRCYGEIRYGPYGIEMIHPEYVLCEKNNLEVEENLTAIYPLTQGLSQKAMRKFIFEGFNATIENDGLPELLPEKFLEKYNLMDIKKALGFIHFPSPDVNVESLEKREHPAYQRVAFEELLAHQLSLKRNKMKAKKYKGPVIKAKKGHEIIEEIVPFKLTNAQKKAIKEIQNDLQKNTLMMRLIQGDVGSGKTVVAAYAALLMVRSGYQVALMAPTEILAEQHFATLYTWFEKDNYNVVWLTGSLSKKEKTEAHEYIKSGAGQLIIGTHALFQDAVSFANLGLIIIDEQHRFGVQQRLDMKSKGISMEYHAHQLIMSATPIPRTMAMVIYADLDISTIDEMPPGRQSTDTIIISNEKRAEIINRVLSGCNDKKQIYWVCPLIEESEKLQCQAAEKTAQLLRQELSDVAIGLIHGRLKYAEKEKIMQQFKRGEINILVATTVIEVGMDVPNATLMVIENAERLGLSQLHQLRGRIGRGTDKSYCILMYQSPLSHTAKTRLQFLRNNNDGFKIARFDMKLRGIGEILGTKQTGYTNFKVVNLIKDQLIIKDVQDVANQLLLNYPDLVGPIISRWFPEGEELIKV